MLVLAAVSISMLTGDSGIVKNAQEAKENTQKSSVKEQIELEVLGSIGTSGKIEMSLLNKNLKNIVLLPWKITTLC